MMDYADDGDNDDDADDGGNGDDDDEDGMSFVDTANLHLAWKKI